MSWNCHDDQQEKDMSQTNEERARQDVIELGTASIETKGAGAGVEPTGIGRLEENGISEE
jgi:hypothetical protein